MIKNLGYIAQETFAFSKKEWEEIPETLKECLKYEIKPKKLKNKKIKNK
jgi:hypothetical protein